mmetsp:Transcript_51746/g.150361  ORF Transcript_51746/g.150361 Transcript_51746/m.150361 type:complete len:250 (-) Transcript_51746:81-830(-)
MTRTSSRNCCSPCGAFCCKKRLARLCFGTPTLSTKCWRCCARPWAGPSMRRSRWCTLPPTMCWMRLSRRIARAIRSWLVTSRPIVSKRTTSSGATGSSTTNVMWSASKPRWRCQCPRTTAVSTEVMAAVASTATLRTGTGRDDNGNGRRGALGGPCAVVAGAHRAAESPRAAGRIDGSSGHRRLAGRRDLRRAPYEDLLILSRRCACLYCAPFGEAAVFLPAAGPALAPPSGRAPRRRMAWAPRPDIAL